MWGRITQIAEKLDDTFGTEEGGESNSNSSSNGGDGWDEGDDFADEDLEFDDDWGNNDQVPADEDELPEAPLASEVDPEILVENGDAPVFEQTNGDAAVSLAQDAPPLDDRVVTVSSPGKALIAGGYLVLESPNPGVVIAAKGCKFYSTVAFRPTFGGASVANNGGGSFIPVDVYSPQFDQVFTYKLSYSQNNSDITLGVRNDGPSESPGNKFIERTLLLTIGYIRTALGDKFTDLLEIPRPNTSLAIKLRADNDSSGGTEVNKTGLGSSAALVTSLVGAMLEFFEVTTLAETEGLTISHNLAQICHCYSQGKVGSGFDVSSAVYGSHVYTRFSKSLIHSLLVGVDKLNTNGESLHLSDTVARDLLDLVNDTTKQWDSTVTPFTLPKDDFAYTPVIGGLERDGAEILANRTAEQWKKPMPSSWHEFEGSSWYVAGKLLDLRMALLESRQNLKGMGNAASVPIEPDVQTKLANATMKLPGVIAVGVPGAGGYDALFVLYVKGEETSDGFSDKVRDNIGDLWNKMSAAADDEIVVCPLNARAAGYGGQDGLCVTNLEW
ncbi:hypothetical protein ACHAWO_008708 [Cyclotella atomus]|uniref:phosphomevalonate kinase n=1 Tax=Cyclotella atomus TaxID=382360 RepID=A0ABD3NAP4_9STRA